MSIEKAENPSLNDEQLLQALRALRQGDLSVRMPEGGAGTAREIATAFNELNDLLRVFSAEVTRIANEVGTEGWFGGQAEVDEVGDSGIWKEITVSINQMATNLTIQVRDMNNVTRAAVNGDLSQRVTVGAERETLELKNNINALLDTLSNQNSA
jgi:methyl-accepting chemotaxis protein